MAKQASKKVRPIDVTVSSARITPSWPPPPTQEQLRAHQQPLNLLPLPAAGPDILLVLVSVSSNGECSLSRSLSLLNSAQQNFLAPPNRSPLQSSHGARARVVPTSQSSNSTAYGLSSLFSLLSRRTGWWP